MLAFLKPVADLSRGVRTLQRDRPSPRPTPPGGLATRLNNALSGLLSRFAEEIASVRG